MKDYYDIMEISRYSPYINLKKQYHKLSIKYHPDKYNDKDKFKSINEAYHILSDKEEKEKYDLLYDLNYYLPIFDDIDYNILYNIYKKIINKNEYKILKILFNNLPNKNEILIKINNYINKNNKLSYFKNKKYIDIRLLNENFNLNFNISCNDLNKLYIFIIYSKNSYYYLFIRNYFEDIIIFNDNKSKLFIKFRILI